MIFGKQNERMTFRKQFNFKKLAPRARFELATLRLTAEMIENLSALSGVAYEKLGAIFPFLVAPKPAPTPMHTTTRGKLASGDTTFVADWCQKTSTIVGSFREAPHASLSVWQIFLDPIWIVSDRPSGSCTVRSTLRLISSVANCRALY